ncbi:MAG: hypothetical protein JW995_05535 [Melioribacteraceae bacterium]|nr:hypothetical protein [Melioribacteraceae bacterium]
MAYYAYWLWKNEESVCNQYKFVLDAFCEDGYCFTEITESWKIKHVLRENLLIKKNKLHGIFSMV